MAVATRIETLNVVDIDTHRIITQTNPGMAGVAIINPSSREGLQTYSALAQVGDDYDEDSYIYKFASNYFNNANSTTLQVISYNPSAQPASGSDPYNFSSFKSAINGHLGNTTTAQMFQSIKSNFGPLFTTGDRQVNGALGDIESQFASGHPHSDRVSNDLTNIHGELTSLSGQNQSNDPAVNALVKYYFCGAEYFVFLVGQNNKQTAVDLSNEVEGQSEHNLVLDIPTSDSEPDFSWLSPIKNNQDTTFLSLPFSGDISDHQFASAVLSERASESPSANLQFVNNLENVDPSIKPQDKYNFTPKDLDQYYKPFNVITYCYRNEVPMLSSGNSADGYQMSNVVTRDYLNYQISNGITNLFIRAHDSGQDIHYDQVGVNRIIAEIGLILNNAKNAGYINNYSVGQINVSRIPDATKETGELDGLRYKWSPVDNIDHIEFHQGIELPVL